MLVRLDRKSAVNLLGVDFSVECVFEEDKQTIEKIDQVFWADATQ
jgi:hypothetical protein